MMDLAIPTLPPEMISRALDDALQVKIDPQDPEFEARARDVLARVLESTPARLAYFDSIERQWRDADQSLGHEGPSYYPSEPGALMRVESSAAMEADGLDRIGPTGWQESETGTRGTVLIVDDSATDLYVLSTYMRDAGFTVRTAVDGWDALAKFDSHVDFMLLDVSMPRMDGIELLEMIHRRGHEVPALMITSHPSVEVQTRAEAAGADGVLAKPAVSPELRARVEQLALRVGA